MIQLLWHLTRGKYRVYIDTELSYLIDTYFWQEFPFGSPGSLCLSVSYKKCSRVPKRMVYLREIFIIKFDYICGRI